MTKSALHAAVLGAMLVVLSQASVHAQAARTWVASVPAGGNDVNACSRTAPCKTFSGALAKTIAGGEISCVDADDYGAVTITKSISIVCDNTEAGIATSTVGVTVNTLASDTVTLSGIDFEGAGTGTTAINFIQGGTLHVHKVRIRNFRGGGTARAFGIFFAPTAAAALHVADSTITDSGTGFGGAGISVFSSPQGATASVTNTRLENNLIGLRVIGAPLDVAVTDSTFVGNSTGIVNSSGNLMVKNVVVANNTNLGIANAGTAASTRMGDSVVTGNPTGVTTSSGIFTSYKNNQIRANTVDGTPLSPETAE
jgi:hypothetical protein